MSMSLKRTIIIALLLTLLVFTGYFSWKGFSQKNVFSFENSAQEQNIETIAEVADSHGSSQEKNELVSGKETTKAQVEIQETQEKPAIKKTQDDSDSEKAGKIIDKPVSWGFQKADSRKIDTIVVHSTYNTMSQDPYSLEGCLQQFNDYQVSAHYIIDRSGKIYRLVEEKNIAYHAGVSKMPDGRTNVNGFSIGIELMIKENSDHPTDGQYDALNFLISDIKKRHGIKYVVGHKDIAPGRKTDPWGFDFGKIKQ